MFALSRRKRFPEGSSEKRWLSGWLVSLIDRLCSSLCRCPADWRGASRYFLLLSEPPSSEPVGPAGWCSLSESEATPDAFYGAGVKVLQHPEWEFEDPRWWAFFTKVAVHVMRPRYLHFSTLSTWAPLMCRSVCVFWCFLVKSTMSSFALVVFNSRLFSLHQAVRGEISER